MSSVYAEARLLQQEREREDVSDEMLLYVDDEEEENIYIPLMFTTHINNVP